MPEKRMTRRISLQKSKELGRLLWPYLILVLHLGHWTLIEIEAQQEAILYQNVSNICDTCICLDTNDFVDNVTSHHMLSCAGQGFQHILARWPKQFPGHPSQSKVIMATFSGNSIAVLQQIPPTDAILRFTCRHCGIRHLQTPTFMDVPNIVALDLAYNELTAEELPPDVFRGPYQHGIGYVSIALMELNLSHNRIQGIDRNLLQHTPNITKLDLSANPLRVIDPETAEAISSATLLTHLDLSYTNLKTIPNGIFRKLLALRNLNLAGNEFSQVPGNLQMVGQSLHSLNLAGNLFEYLDELSFLGLKVLRQLNVSGMPILKGIENGTFDHLETLTDLDASHNPNLQRFDLNGLIHSINLTHLDISYCYLKRISLNVDLEEKPEKTVEKPKPWLKLRSFRLEGNPWFCDCQFLLLLEYVGIQRHPGSEEVLLRCDDPYHLAGVSLSNLNASYVCRMPQPRIRGRERYEQPRFRRKRYIILTLYTATIVLFVGVLIGFMVVFLKRRLKRPSFGIEPIRYTSVRSSNISALSQLPLAINGNMVGSGQNHITSTTNHDLNYEM